MSASVGPNAILQVAAALRARDGEGFAAALFEQVGLGPLWRSPPTRMVPEAEAGRLHRALRRQLDAEHARLIAEEAGRRTADYLLANRIPRPVQWLLRALPAPLAAHLLLRAIVRNAWTFAGSGQVRIARLRIEIAANPLATAPCDWHRAVFERLFRVLVSPQARVVETDCCGDGAAACVFEIALESNIRSNGIV